MAAVVPYLAMTRYDIAAAVSIFYLAFEIGCLRLRVKTLESALTKEPKK